MRNCFNVDMQTLILGKWKLCKWIFHVISILLSTSVIPYQVLLLPRTKLWFHLTSSGDSKMTQSFFVCLIGPLIGALTEISVDVFTVGLEWRGYIYVWNLPLTYFSSYRSKSSLMYPKEVLAVEHFPVVSSLNSTIFHSCLLDVYEGIFSKYWMYSLANIWV